MPLKSVQIDLSLKGRQLAQFKVLGEDNVREFFWFVHHERSPMWLPGNDVLEPIFLHSLEHGMKTNRKLGADSSSSRMLYRIPGFGIPAVVVVVVLDHNVRIAMPVMGWWLLFVLVTSTAVVEAASLLLFFFFEHNKVWVAAAATAADERQSLGLLLLLFHDHAAAASSINVGPQGGRSKVAEAHDDFD